MPAAGKKDETTKPKGYILRVVKIIGDEEMLVGSDEKGKTQLSYVLGVSTKGLAEGGKVELTGRFESAGTKYYERKTYLAIRPESEATKVRREAREAAIELDLIKPLLKDGKKAEAKKRLEKLIKDFPKTKAAEEAKDLLAGL
jgi:hypothetical protein